MTDFLSSDEIKYYADFLINLMGKVKITQINSKESYFTKFYKFPLIRFD